LNNTEKASITALLGRCFISEVDRKTLDLILNESILEVLEKLSPGFTGYMNESIWDNSRLEQLASEYCHLFILPGKEHVSLRMSHWVKDNTFDTTVLENTISEMGFDFESLKVSKTPSDHLGVLLYFMSGVYSSEDEEVSNLSSDLEKQLFFWITAFEAKLNKFSKSPFYPTCTKLLLETLSTDE
jgi:TorA maturation chaperone TorD